MSKAIKGRLPVADLAIVGCLVTLILLLLWLAVADASGPRRPIPKAANAVDQAATEIAETADATEQVVRWVHAKCLAWDREGKIRGRLVFKVMGLPIAMIEAEIDLPKQKG